jgi:hypothetical protein
VLEDLEHSPIVNYSIRLRLLVSTDVVDVLLEVGNRRVLHKTDPVQEEGMNKIAAPNVSGCQIGSTNASEGLDGFRHVVNITCLAVATVDVLHDDTAYRTCRMFPLEGLEDTRYLHR